jgi:hypothetical protein
VSRVLRFTVTRNVRPPGRSDARPKISCSSSWEALAAPLDISSARPAVHLTCSRDRNPHGPETPGGSGSKPEALSGKTRPAAINKSARAPWQFLAGTLYLLVREDALSAKRRGVLFRRSSTHVPGRGNFPPRLPGGICRGGWPCRFDFRDTSRTRRKAFLMTDESAAAASRPSHYRASLRARGRSADV